MASWTSTWVMTSGVCMNSLTISRLVDWRERFSEWKGDSLCLEHITFLGSTVEDTNCDGVHRKLRYFILFLNWWVEIRTYAYRCTTWDVSFHPLASRATVGTAPWTPSTFPASSNLPTPLTHEDGPSAALENLPNHFSNHSFNCFDSSDIFDSFDSRRSSLRGATQCPSTSQRNSPPPSSTSFILSSELNTGFLPTSFEAGSGSDLLCGE